MGESPDNILARKLAEETTKVTDELGGAVPLGRLCPQCPDILQRVTRTEADLAHVKQRGDETHATVKEIFTLLREQQNAEAKLREEAAADRAKLEALLKEQASEAARQAVAEGALGRNVATGGVAAGVATAVIATVEALKAHFMKGG